MRKLHCITGLSADHRIFRNLIIPGYTLVPVLWPTITAGTSMQELAAQIAAAIPESEEDAILGVSLGGMIATEIKRLRPSVNVIIVSSAKSPQELPQIPGWVRFVGKNRLIPMGLAMDWQLDQIWRKLGATTKGEKDLMQSMYDSSNKHFLTCALAAILNWDAGAAPEGIIQIHGKADLIITPESVHPTYWIDRGTHIMVYNKAEEVSSLIARHLS